MLTAIDTSVVLDFVTDDVVRGDSAERALRQARREGALLVGECVVAELRPAFAQGELEEFLADWEIRFVPASFESAELAGRHFREYLRRGSDRRVVVPDFLIGAHAQVHADRLLARDREYLRDYFRACPQNRVLEKRRSVSSIRLLMTA